MILHLLTKRCLQDDYQSADTNPADFKLQLTMMRKQIWNFELREAEIYFKAVFVVFCFFCAASINQTEMDAKQILY